MILSTLSISLLIFGCSSAPFEGPEKIGLSLDSLNPRLVEIANQHITSLADTASQKAEAINGLVGQATKTIEPVYQSVSDTFHTGLNTVSETAGRGLAGVRQSVSDGITAVSGNLPDLNSVKDSLTDHLQAASSGISANIEVVGGLANQGASYVQGSVDGIADTVGTAVNQKTAALTTYIQQAKNALPPAGPFADRPRKIENAILEQEDILSKKQSIKDNLQSVIVGIFQPEPVVDNIREEEKYGNNGDQFAAVGKALVGTTEGLAKFFSNAINIPFDAFKSITRAASDKLNNLGARLIGL